MLLTYKLQRNKKEFIKICLYIIYTLKYKEKNSNDYHYYFINCDCMSCFCVACGLRCLWVVAYVLGYCVRAWAGGLCGCVPRSARWGG